MAVTPQEKLAVLSYHSWEVEAEIVLTDIAALRARGWTSVGLKEGCAFIAKRERGQGRLFLVTSDDGSPKDEEFAAVLRQAECPGVFFVNAGNIAEERVAFYRSLGEDITVEDHGFWHRKQFVSACVYDFVTPGSYLGGLEHLSLKVGMPLCPTGSEVATRRFVPEPGAMELAVEVAAGFGGETGSPGWRLWIEDELVKEGLAFRRLGRTLLKGSFEGAREWESRVASYLVEGRQAFTVRIGRPPEYFAYPWWQGSPKADEILQALGYKGSFYGTFSCQGKGRRPYAMPRIPIDRHTPRPLNLDKIPMRPLMDFGNLTVGAKYRLKALLGMR